MLYRRLIPVFLLPAALALSSRQIVAQASAPAALPSHYAAAPGKVTLVIKITRTGKTVWGWVWAAWTNPQTQAAMKKKCSKQQCTWSLPAQVPVHFRQKPKDASTWPFSAWTVAAGGSSRRISKASFSVTLAGSTTVTATYVLS